VRTGVLAAAVTAGALVGLGMRHEAALQPFLQAGRSLLTTSSGLVPLAWLALAGGLAIHLAWMTAWGLAFTLLAPNWPRSRLALFAVGFVAVLGVTASLRMPRALGVVGMASLTAPQLAFVLALMAAALFAGVRLAPVSRT
jgi:hypothetical protein